MKLYNINKKYLFFLFQSFNLTSAISHAVFKNSNPLPFIPPLTRVVKNPDSESLAKKCKNIAYQLEIFQPSVGSGYYDPNSDDEEISEGSGLDTISSNLPSECQVCTMNSDCQNNGVCNLKHRICECKEDFEGQESG